MSNRTAYEINSKNGEAIIRYCIPIAKSVRHGVLDCKKSWARESTDKSWEEILEMAVQEGNAYWTFIHMNIVFMGGNGFYDVGIATMNSPSYFIFIDLEVEVGEKVIKEFNLKLKEW